MRRSFYEKVKRHGSVDTRKYRYVIEDYGNVARLPLEYLDTTRAEDGWKIPVEWK